MNPTADESTRQTCNSTLFITVVAPLLVCLSSGTNPRRGNGTMIAGKFRPKIASTKREPAHTSHQLKTGNKIAISNLPLVLALRSRVGASAVQYSTVQLYLYGVECYTVYCVYCILYHTLMKRVGTNHTVRRTSQFGNRCAYLYVM
jgi:hypothetical protein